MHAWLGQQVKHLVYIYKFIWFVTADRQIIIKQLLLCCSVQHYVTHVVCRSAAMLHVQLMQQKRQLIIIASIRAAVVYC
jgi:hypothetical protein